MKQDRPPKFRRPRLYLGYRDAGHFFDEDVGHPRAVVAGYNAPLRRLRKIEPRGAAGNVRHRATERRVKIARDRVASRPRTALLGEGDSNEVDTRKSGTASGDRLCAYLVGAPNPPAKAANAPRATAGSADGTPCCPVRCPKRFIGQVPGNCFAHVSDIPKLSVRRENSRSPVVEQWADRAALLAHFGVPASRNFVRALQPLATAATTIEIYDATRLEGL
jgi:quinol monooxygenase YgiN